MLALFTNNVYRVSAGRLSWLYLDLKKRALLSNVAVNLDIRRPKRMT